MKLTIAQLSEKTRISVPTLRVYVSRYRLGRREGTNRFFSEADVKKLLERSTRRGAAPAGKARAAKPAKKAAKKAVKKAAKKAAGKTAKRPAKKATAKIAASAAKQPAPAAPAAVETRAPQKRPSFWARLFGGRTKEKVSLQQAAGR
jgi:DNA-binding transcriptional MerR regulator